MGLWAWSGPLNWSPYAVYLGGCVATDTTGSFNLTIHKRPMSDAWCAHGTRTKLFFFKKEILYECVDVCINHIAGI